MTFFTAAPHFRHERGCAPVHEIGQEQFDRTRNRCRPYAKSAPHRGRKENRMENRMKNTKMLTDEELAKELAKMTPAERAQAMAYVMGLVAGKAQAKATEPAGGAA